MDIIDIEKLLNLLDVKQFDNFYVKHVNDNRKYFVFSKNYCYFEEQNYNVIVSYNKFYKDHYIDNHYDIIYNFLQQYFKKELRKIKYNKIF